MPFSLQPKKSKDSRTLFRMGELFASPLDIGVWSILEPAGQQNHAPQLCWISDNELACVWMAGDQEGVANMSIFGSLLKKGKTRWSKPLLLSQDAERSEQNPVLFVGDEGRLHLIHTAQETRKGDDEDWKSQGQAFSKQWTAKLRHQSTKAWGQRWSKAKDLTSTPAFCRQPPVQTSQGAWLLPIYRSLEEGGVFGKDHSSVLLLDAQAVVQGSPIEVPDSTGRVHGNLVRSADGQRWLQFFRSRLADCVYRSIGSLDGQHWTRPEPVPLPNNNSSIQVLRLRSGLLVMAFNRFNAEVQTQREWGDAIWPRTRWPLSLAASMDDGASWPWIRDVDHGLGFCGEANWHLNMQLAYPSIVEGIDDEIHLAYSWGNRAAIRHMCLHVRDLIGK